jgi:hypothetical protein
MRQQEIFAKTLNRGEERYKELLNLEQLYSFDVLIINFQNLQFCLPYLESDKDFSEIEQFFEQEIEQSVGALQKCIAIIKGEADPKQTFRNVETFRYFLSKLILNILAIFFREEYVSDFNLIRTVVGNLVANFEELHRGMYSDSNTKEEELVSETLFNFSKLFFEELFKAHILFLYQDQSHSEPTMSPSDQREWFEDKVQKFSEIDEEILRVFYGEKNGITSLDRPLKEVAYERVNIFFRKVLSELVLKGETVNLELAFRFATPAEQNNTFDVDNFDYLLHAIRNQPSDRWEEYFYDFLEATRNVLSNPSAIVEGASRYKMGALFVKTSVSYRIFYKATQLVKVLVNAGHNEYGRMVFTLLQYNLSWLQKWSISRPEILPLVRDQSETLFILGTVLGFIKEKRQNQEAAWIQEHKPDSELSIVDVFEDLDSTESLGNKIYTTCINLDKYRQQTHLDFLLRNKVLKLASLIISTEASELPTLNQDKKNFFEECQTVVFAAYMKLLDYYASLASINWDWKTIINFRLSDTDEKVVGDVEQQNQSGKFLRNAAAGSSYDTLYPYLGGYGNSHLLEIVDVVLPIIFEQEDSKSLETVLNFLLATKNIGTLHKIFHLSSFSSNK